MIRHRRFALLEELEIVRLAHAKRRRDNLLGYLIGDDLGFLGVALFLAAVGAPLFF